MSRVLTCPGWALCNVYLCPGNNLVMDCPGSRAPGLVLDECRPAHRGKEILSIARGELLGVLVDIGDVRLVTGSIVFTGRGAYIASIGTLRGSHIMRWSPHVIRTRAGLVAYKPDSNNVIFLLYRPAPLDELLATVFRGWEVSDTGPLIHGAPSLGEIYYLAGPGDDCGANLVSSSGMVCGGFIGRLCLPDALRPL